MGHNRNKSKGETIDSFSSTSSSSTSSLISTSFKSLAAKEPPIQYDTFATTYICRQIPNFENAKTKCTRRLSVGVPDDESEISSPFKNPVVLPEFEIKERVDPRILHESVRLKNIIPDSRIILRQIYGKNLEFDSKEARHEFLYLKAKEWCEVTKALVLDQRFPKVDKGLLIKRSRFHRKAGKCPETLNSPENEPLICPEEGLERENKTLSDLISGILGPREPLPFDSADHIPWQFKVLQPHPIPPKKKLLHWKRNIYPPQSVEERIQELRKKLPAPKPPHLQTDQLSGIWDPSIMNPEFKITGPLYDSRLSVETSPLKLDWYELEFVMEKCWSWLSADDNDF